MIKDYNESLDKGVKIQTVIVGGLAVGWLLPERAVIGGLINGTFEAGVQYLESPDGSINWDRVAIQTGTGAVTGGLGTGLFGTIAWNAVGGAASNAVEGKDSLTGAIVVTITSGIGYRAGKLLEVPFGKYFNPVSKQYEWVPIGTLTITKPASQSSIPALGGTTFDTVTSGILDKIINDKLKKNKNESK